MRVEKEISDFSIPSDFVPMQGGQKCVFFFLFVDDIFFPGASKLSFTFGLPRAAIFLEADIFFVSEIDSVELVVSSFGWRLLRAMPSVNNASLLS